MASQDGKSRRPKGQIEKRSSGSFRVSVYAGVDPVTHRRVYARESVPAGPKARSQAERVRTRLANEVYERRTPKTDATVDHLIKRHLETGEFEFSTLSGYKVYFDKHISPLLGKVKISGLNGEVFDSFYAELRRCRDHCRGTRGNVDHRTRRPHDCDQRCAPHQCKPLGASAVRQIHFILSGALSRAVRWGWISVSPIALASPPPAAKPNPRPPAAAEAARIINEAWNDPDWGALVWLTMVTGHRRGELCGIRWRHLDLDNGVLHLEKSIGQWGGRRWEKDTKAHQDRRIALDPETIGVLKELRERWRRRAEALDGELSADAFVFSLAPDGSTHLLPESVTQRYGRMCRRLGIDSSLHKLRHYSATELINAGVNVRTVAGRLGHGGGGTVTLRTYTAWVSESDQRAAGDLAARMPARPEVAALPERQEFEPTSPYERIAVSLRDDIYEGKYPIGLPIPPVKKLARSHGVSVSTALRAVRLLGDWGLVRIRTSRPTIVQPRVEGERDAHLPAAIQDDGAMPLEPSAASPGVHALDLEVRRPGTAVATLQTNADPTDTTVLHRLLVGAVKRSGAQADAIDEFELVVRAAGKEPSITTYVAVAP